MENNEDEFTEEELVEKIKETMRVLIEWFEEEYKHTHQTFSKAKFISMSMIMHIDEAYGYYLTGSTRITTGDEEFKQVMKDLYKDLVINARIITKCTVKLHRKNLYRYIQLLEEIPQLMLLVSEVVFNEMNIVETDDTLLNRNFLDY